eukprot:2296413-Lingulodinium_polyedra.AAC.1
MATSRSETRAPERCTGGGPRGHATWRAKRSPTRIPSPGQRSLAARAEGDMPRDVAEPELPEGR